MTQLSRLRDRIALVSGGGSGIGRATALRIAEEGARVFLVGRDEKKLKDTAAKARDLGTEAELMACDLRLPDSANTAVDAAADWGGGLHILVNCAGTFPSAPFATLSDTDWNEALEINLAAPMRLSRAAVNRMSKGTIVNVSSINAVIGDKLSQCSHYAAAKAGLLGLTRQLAIELAPRITVNAVLPGAVQTPLLAGWNEDPKDMATWLERFVPLQRIAKPEEIAAVIAFLASEDASYLTGAAVMADGGMSIV